MSGGFFNQYLNSLPDEDRLKLRELALEYHQKCEEYDRSVCTGPVINGSIIPMGYEIGLVNKNAMRVLKELHKRMLETGLTGDLWSEIILAEREFKYEKEL
jgi:hypothetical protein